MEKDMLTLLLLWLYVLHKSINVFKVIAFHVHKDKFKETPILYYGISCIEMIYNLETFPCIVQY